MRKPGKITLAAAAVITLAALGASPAFASAGPGPTPGRATGIAKGIGSPGPKGDPAAGRWIASDSITEVCGNKGGGYCLNDWNGAGNGGAVKMYYGGYANDNYQEYYLSGMCGNGLVNAQASCPFTPGSGLNTQFNGDHIFAVISVSGWCVGTSQSSESAIQTQCPDVNGNGGGWGTILVNGYDSNCVGGAISYDESRYWSDNHGSADSLQSGGNPGVQAFFSAGQAGTGTCWGYVHT